mmetsp:Transcript_8649/g.12759  ORF Transcript_8649/g.12759 Transcript_8649/m.12759 type:complete len:225 (+) Transcript_8649:93-767(+)
MKSMTHREERSEERLRKRCSFYMGPQFVVEDVNCLPSVSDAINHSSKETGISIPAYLSNTFDRDFYSLLKESFGDKGSVAAANLDDFLSTGLSNGRKLHLQVMAIPKSKCFKIHAHPNIEFEYTLLGALHEFRWIGPPVPKEELVGSKEDLVGPDIASMAIFEKMEAREGEFIVNEIGSVHQSFTDNEIGVIFVCLWSGCHANTPPHRVFCKDRRLRPSAGWDL